MPSHFRSCPNSASFGEPRSDAGFTAEEVLKTTLIIGEKAPDERPIPGTKGTNMVLGGQGGEVFILKLPTSRIRT